MKKNRDQKILRYCTFNVSSLSDERPRDPPHVYFCYMFAPCFYLSSPHYLICEPGLLFIYTYPCYILVPCPTYPLLIIRRESQISSSFVSLLHIYSLFLLILSSLSDERARYPLHLYSCCKLTPCSYLSYPHYMMREPDIHLIYILAAYWHPVLTFPLLIIWREPDILFIYILAAYWLPVLICPLLITWLGSHVFSSSISLLHVGSLLLLILFSLSDEGSRFPPHASADFVLDSPCLFSFYTVLSVLMTFSVLQ